MGKGYERFGHHRQVDEIELIVLEEGEDVEPQFWRGPLVLYRFAFLLGANGIAGFQGDGLIVTETMGVTTVMILARRDSD